MSFDTVEQATHLYQAVIKDETGVAIPAASLTTLKLTLYDKLTNTILNGVSGRNYQNVLNANGVTVDASGNVAWTGTGGPSGDNIILNAKRQNEIHVALWQFTWSSGTKYGYWAVELNCKRLVNVPSFPTP